MKNLIIILIIQLLIIFSIHANNTDYSDNTDDKTISSEKIDDIEKYQKKENHIFWKFRGSMSLVADYMTEYTDGINPGNGYKKLSYEGVDTRFSNTSMKTPGDPGRLIGGSWGGVQAKYFIQYSAIAMLPFFKNALMKDSYLKFTGNFEISPVSFNIGAQITYSPVAFLVLNTGFLIGPGWQVNSELSGLGINRDGIIERLSFGGPVIQQWFSLTFQMDTAYLVPQRFQKWTHIVFLGTTTIKYQALLGIDSNQPYMYEECPGEQLGGWRFIADALLGYRFFFIEDNDFDNGKFIKMNNKNLVLTGGMYIWLDYLDISHFNDSPMKTGWGSDFAFLNFGPAMQLDLPYNFYIKLFALFRNDRAYTDNTVGNRDFRDRKYEDYYVFFRWGGAIIGWNF